jgi:hypothetical protein
LRKIDEIICGFIKLIANSELVVEKKVIAKVISEECKGKLRESGIIYVLNEFKLAKLLNI